MDPGIPPLKIQNLTESKPLNSTLLVCESPHTIRSREPRVREPSVREARVSESAFPREVPRGIGKSHPSESGIHLRRT